MDARHTMLSLTLTAENRAEFTRFTTENVGRQVQIVLDGGVASQPTVRNAIQGSSLTIAVSSPDEALKTAKALLKQIP
jgi:preprotein translocase subunit SecD